MAKIPANRLEEIMKANPKTTMVALAGIALSAFTTIVSGDAALAQDTARVRGTIESIDGSTYVIKARDGVELKVALADKAQIAAVVKASLSDIKPGLFVGVTAIPQADGSLSALEVHIFPEAMRGTGEGHYSWDLRPQSTMTNANVDQVVTAVDGQTLTLKYKDGEKKIFVAADTPIVAYVGATITISSLARKSSSLRSSSLMERCEVARGG
jgi:outer membrane lipoprotein SlyB